ncbi:hypothetical protein M2155_000624 [Streptomyces sp. SAI-119]|uniref:hypothetical protein n=1 Tax=Streptomyces sp. SAI-119 TaxID=2940541 RepID=UPI0024732490|nr:hypothetical protein [Streptomyces sp. SAI-119]MDH6448216.1 hypothetical protein [Streptomyces sp. SAI-119]
MSYDHNTSPLELTLQNARNHQREMAAHGNEAGVRNAQAKIDATLDELDVQYTLKRYRATD